MAWTGLKAKAKGILLL